MTSSLTVFLLVLLVPLFLASWRMTLFGLAAQGFVMASMAWSAGHHRAADLVAMIDLGLVRGVIVPYAIYRVLQRQNRPARNDVIPANMLSWAMVAVLLGLAFRGASWLHPGSGPEHLRVAVGSAGVLFGLFVLATQNGAFGQAIGALRIENAIALFEVASDSHEPLGLAIARSIVFLATAIAYAVYVDRIAPALPASPAPEESAAS